MQGRPPWRPTGGTGILMILILAVVLGGLGFYAWRSSPPDAPNPAATAAPATLPPASAPVATAPAAPPR